MKVLITLAAVLAAVAATPARAERGRTIISDGVTLTLRRGAEPVVQGSGVPAREGRAVPPFSEVTADDGANIEISIGPQRALEVQADDNLLGRVTTTVENGRLLVGVSGSYATRTPPTVRLVTPSLSGVVLRSSSRASLDGLHGGALLLESNGSGGFDARGRLDAVTIRLNGSGKADLAQAAAENVDVAVNGSGEAVVRAARRLTAVANGSGRISYIGRPAMLRTAVHGVGSIAPAIR